MSDIRKTIALGLDGATWRILDPLIRGSKLPSLKRITDEGVYADMQSVIPPVTCPAWKCYSTGKNPGKLGVFWWAGFDKEKGRITVPHAYSFKSRDLWDYLGDAGKKVAIINMPTTYPPKQVNGIMISGFGTPIGKNLDFQQYTYPRELQEKIENRYAYEPMIENISMYGKKRLAKKIQNVIGQRFRLMREFLENGEYDFLHLTIFYINVLQHFLGDDIVVEEAWKFIDSQIGDLMKSGYTLILFSDHGSMNIKGSFVINRWLAEEGYLKIKSDFGDVLNRIDDAIMRVLKVKRRYFGGAAGKILPNAILTRIPGIYGSIPTGYIDLKIDWENSDAVALSQGPIYINDKRVGAGYEDLRDELISKLKDVKDPRNGNRIIDKVYRRDELYSGQYVAMAPDIILLPNEGYEIYGGIDKEIFQSKRVAWTTGNHPTGIFLAFGHGIKRGEKIEKIGIMDIAPTILHIFGTPIPDDMDGRVLKEIFEEDSELEVRRIVYQKVGEREAIKKRIRDLKKTRLV